MCLLYLVTGLFSFLVIEGKTETIRACLEGGSYDEGNCVNNSDVISGVSSADFCVCKSDLCNDVPIRPIQSLFFIVFVSALINLLVN